MCQTLIGREALNYERMEEAHDSVWGSRRLPELESQERETHLFREDTSMYVGSWVTLTNGRSCGSTYEHPF